MPTTTLPIIAITPDFNYETNTYEVRSAYFDAVFKSGGYPVMPAIQQDMPSSCTAHIKNCNGIILTGGQDIDTRIYNEEVRPASGTISPLRDKFEIELAKTAFTEGIPILGICRGIQILNVALGGTIYQDLGEINMPAPIKHMQNAPKWYPSHGVESAPNTLIREIYGRSFTVNSFHHQCIKDIAPVLSATAFSADGLIEALESALPDSRIIGVQWHPEHLFPKCPSSLRLFKWLINSCRR